MSSLKLPPLPLRLFDFAFTLTALFGTRFVSMRSWKIGATAFFLTLMVTSTMSSFAVRDEQPQFIAIFIMTLITALMLPWGGRWQMGFAATGLIASVVAGVAGVIPESYGAYWMILTIAIVFSVTIAFLKDNSHQQRLLIAELQDRGTTIAFARVRDQVRERMRLDGLEAAVGPQNFHDRVTDGVRAWQESASIDLASER